jgi:flagellar biosynthesis protein FlhB
VEVIGMALVYVGGVFLLALVDAICPQGNHIKRFRMSSGL